MLASPCYAYRGAHGYYGGRGYYTATAGIMGMAGDVAGTLTGGGAPWDGRTTTGALGATHITGATPIMGIILTCRPLMAVIKGPD
jgi:hypothetical protein